MPTWDRADYSSKWVKSSDGKDEQEVEEECKQDVSDSDEDQPPHVEEEYIEQPSHALPKPPTEEGSTYRASEENEGRFRNALRAERGFVVVDQAMDGNCLFRSVSHQVYGTEEHHLVVREKCLQYIESQSYFFENFVPNESIQSYARRMKVVGVWGGDVEIQAMAEMYNRPIELYVYSTTSRRVYCKDVRPHPIRLSYHFRCHYNSVVDLASRMPFLQSRPGVAEDEFIRRASRVRRRPDPTQEAMSHSDREATETETLRQALEGSRHEFHRFETAQCDLAAQASLVEFEARMVAQLKAAKLESERNYQEEEIVNSVLQSSRDSKAPSKEEEVVKAVMRQSLATANSSSSPRPSPQPSRNLSPGEEAVRTCVQLGYPEEVCVEAYSILSSDPAYSKRRKDEVIAMMVDYIQHAMADY